MKTFEDVLKKAVSIADNDANARVAVFDLRVRQKLPEFPGWIGEGLYKAVHNTYYSPSGGQVRFLDIGFEIWDQIAGSQFTHVFVSEFVGRCDEALIANRIRFIKEPFPEKSGLYKFNGLVTRTEVW